jgi:hypothetical protein
VCVWSSSSPTGKPQKTYRQGKVVSLIAAWRLAAIPKLKKYHLAVRWTVYAGFQKDVSLRPLTVDTIASFKLRDPSSPQAGVFRLVKAPRLKNLEPGWYSVVGQTNLYGPKCGKSGCTGQIRQNRIHIKK